MMGLKTYVRVFWFLISNGDYFKLIKAIYSELKFILRKESKNL